jgi:hypothetical protein
MLIRLLLLRALAPRLYRLLVGAFLAFVSLFYLLAGVSILTGCSSETDQRLEEIEKRNRETQELYRQKAEEFRRQLRTLQSAGAADTLEEAAGQTGRDGRFDDWLTQSEVIDRTGLTTEEIDWCVLRGELRGVRQPDLSILYDPAGVEDLVRRIRDDSSGRDQP